MEHKEGLKEMITRPPFVPTKPIGRKEFFFGFLIIAIVALVFNAGLAFLLGGSNLIAAGVIALIASYIVATWYTKRFLDITPKTNAKMFQIILFILIFALNILTYIQAGMLAELRAFSDYIVMNGLVAGGAPEVSQFSIMYGMPVSIARAVLGIPLLLFALFLFFKKGKETGNISQ